MLSFAISFWLPSATGYSGIVKYLVWLFLVESKWIPKSGVYGLRVRFCGFSVEIQLFMPVSEENEQEITVSARSVAPDGTSQDVPLNADSAEWVKRMAAHGIKMLIGRREMYVDSDNSFVMPAELDVLEIGIGDKIVFGDSANHILVSITGSRVQEDQSTIFYGKQLPIQ